MLRTSFRWLAGRVYPSSEGGKLASAAVAAALLGLVLAGCGGGKKEPAAARTQHVRGVGFSFAAPAGWRVVRAPGRVSVAPPHDVDSLLSVQRYRLLKRYRPGIFPAVARELDARTAALARLRHGHVGARRTVRIDGRRAREYDVLVGKTVERLAYVLRGVEEYLLTCQFRRDGDDPVGAACAPFLASFRLGAPPA